MGSVNNELAQEIANSTKQPESTAAATQAAETTTEVVETAATTTSAEAQTTAVTETATTTTTEENVDEGEVVAEDYLETYFPKPDATTTAAATTETQATEPAGQVADTTKYEALEKALQDPKTQWILEQYNKGLDPIAELVKINEKDPSRYKAIDLFKMQIEEMRKSEEYTDEQVQEYIEDFSAKNPLEQSNLVAAYRDKLNNEYNTVRESLRPTFNAEEAQRKYQEQQDAITNKALEDLSSWKNSEKGKDFYGLEWTDERLNQLESFMKTPEAVIVPREDGTFDIERSARINARELFFRDILKTAITNTKNKVAKEVLAKRHNTNSDTVGRTPVQNNKNSMDVWLDSKA